MPAPLRPNDPTRIGPYIIKERLGSGGFGDVYLGQTPGRYRVAVKVVKAELADDERFRGRFAAEVRAATKVKGLYTAPVVAADVTADQPWVATEYVAGPTLAAHVATHGPMPPRAVAEMAVGIAEGLEHIHGQQIVHRDLKPQNVMMTDNGPKVIDFGIARAMEETSHTPASKLVGTAAYMSPEQAHGSRDIDHRSDVFSFGAVLFFAATGRSVWGSGLPLEVLHRVAFNEPELSAVTDPRLRLLIASCLDKSPAARPSLTTVRLHLAELFTDSGPDPESAAGADPARPAVQDDDTTRETDRSQDLVHAAGRPDPAPEPGPTLPAPVPAPGPVPTPADSPAEHFSLTTAGMRAARVATYLGRIALLPLAVLAGASVFELFAYQHESVTDLVVLALPLVALLVLLYVTTRSRPRIHDRIEVGENGIRVVDQRVLYLRRQTRFVPGFRVVTARLVIEDDLCAVVCTFPPTSTAPIDIWGPRHEVYRHRHGYVLTWFRADSPALAATARNLGRALDRATRAWQASNV